MIALEAVGALDHTRRDLATLVREIEVGMGALSAA
jgi:hypothetical protein